MRGDTLHGICAGRMASFNEIPDYLKSDDRKAWTVKQGLIWGAVAVIAAAATIGAAHYWITYWAPGVTMNGLLSIATTFFMTWVLFAIMHRVSGVIHPVGNAIAVVAMIAVVMAKLLACRANAIDASPAATGAWSELGLAVLIFADFPAWAALAFATFACRNGGVSLQDILEFVTRRP